MKTLHKFNVNKLKHLYESGCNVSTIARNSKKLLGSKICRQTVYYFINSRNWKRR